MTTESNGPRDDFVINPHPEFKDQFSGQKLGKGKKKLVEPPNIVISKGGLVATYKNAPAVKRGQAQDIVVGYVSKGGGPVVLPVPIIRTIKREKPART